jgi:hypothetical protein
MVTDLLEALAALEWEFAYPRHMGFIEYKDVVNEEDKRPAKERAALIVELLLEKGIIDSVL